MIDDFHPRMERAARIVGYELIPAAMAGVDPLCEAADRLDGRTVRHCLVFMVRFHREHSDHLLADVPAVDALMAAAETGDRELYDVTQELHFTTALEALVALVGLDRDLAVLPYIAASAAQNN